MARQYPPQYSDDDIAKYDKAYDMALVDKQQLALDSRRIINKFAPGTPDHKGYEDGAWAEGLRRRDRVLSMMIFAVLSGVLGTTTIWLGMLEYAGAGTGLWAVACAAGTVLSILRLDSRYKFLVKQLR